MIPMIQVSSLLPAFWGLVVIAATAPVQAPQPSPNQLKLSDDVCKAVTDYLPLPGLMSLMRVARYHYEHLSKDSRIKARLSPWFLRVRLQDGTSTWLDPGEDAQWTQAVGILEANPRYLAESPPLHPALLDRLPLVSWGTQLRASAKDQREPLYLESISNILTGILPSIMRRQLSFHRATTQRMRQEQAALTFLCMLAYNKERARAPWWVIRALTGNEIKPYFFAARNQSVAPLLLRIAAPHKYWGHTISMVAALDAPINILNHERDVRWLETHFPPLIQPLAGTSPLPLLEAGRVAYRAAELSTDLLLLQHCEAIVTKIFAEVLPKITAKEREMFSSYSSWTKYKRHALGELTTHPEFAHSIQPWITEMDAQMVQIERYRLRHQRRLAGPKAQTSLNSLPSSVPPESSSAQDSIDR